ncbi:MAG TPA: UDP-N-acetylmuramate--L-alanine ligase [Myxococcales bacterium]|nr:UDP-N-acetylmuramate--L-alanine ligase [Myxococcales bacterium]
MFRNKKPRIHFVGIGGIGMSGIAEVLLNLGYQVSGSDLKASDITERLGRLGGRIEIGHRREHVEGADVVVTSSAVRRDNPEVAAAREKGIPVIPRAEMLAELMRLKTGIAVAGSHGKTTTTSMVAHVLAAAGLDPTAVVGGRLNNLGSNAKLGKSEWMVVEADESDGSFLRLTPTLAIVTNVDPEHLDHYGDAERLRVAFLEFINRVPFYGLAILCLDHPVVQGLLPQVEKRHVTYGFAPQADYRAEKVELAGFRSTFLAWRRQESLGAFELAMVGGHNVQNALAAIAVADELAIPLEVTREALAAFRGVDRRFTVRGEAGGVTVVDDYGHHPAEVRATLAGARAAFGRRLVVLFQPHRFTRTRDLLEEFATAFNDADALVAMEIYAAGEDPIPGVSGASLAEVVRSHGHRDVAFAPDRAAAVAAMLERLRPGDIALTLGAGDVTKIGPELLAALEQRP